MKKLLFSIVLCLATLIGFSQVRETIIVDSIPRMKTYSGGAEQIFVKDTLNGGQFYLYVGPMVADESTIFAGANSRKWRRLIEADEVLVLNGLRQYTSSAGRQIGIGGSLDSNNIVLDFNSKRLDFKNVTDWHWLGLPISSSNDSILVKASDGTVKLHLFPAAGATYTFSAGLTNSSGTIYNNVLTGISGGQTFYGGINGADNMVLVSTTNLTKGKIVFGAALTSAYDEVNDRLGIGTASPTSPLTIAKNVSTDLGAIRINNNDPDIVLNDVDGGINTVLFKVADNFKWSFGRFSDDNFYWGRFTGGSWFDNTLVLNYTTGAMTVGNLAHGVAGNKKWVTADQFGTFSNVDISTTNVPQGTNKYYTDSAARLSVSTTGTGISYNNTTGVFTGSALTSFNGRSTAAVVPTANDYSFSMISGSVADGQLSSNIAKLNAAAAFTSNVSANNLSVNAGGALTVSGWGGSGNRLITTNNSGVATPVTLSTSSIPEGINEYFTNAKSRNSVSATGTGIAYDNSTGVFTGSALTSFNGRSTAAAVPTSGDYSFSMISGSVTDGQLSSNVALKNINNNFSTNQTIGGTLLVNGSAEVKTDDSFGLGLKFTNTTSPTNYYVTLRQVVNGADDVSFNFSQESHDTLHANIMRFIYGKTEIKDLRAINVANYLTDVSGNYTSRSFIDKGYLDVRIAAVPTVYTSNGTISSTRVMNSSSTSNNFLIGNSGTQFGIIQLSAAKDVSIYGGFQQRSLVVTSDANLTIPHDYSVVELDANITANRIINLPTGAGVGNGKTYIIVNKSSTITPNNWSFNTTVLNKDGTTVTTLTGYTTYVVMMDSSLQWRLILKY